MVSSPRSNLDSFHLSTKLHTTATECSRISIEQPANNSMALSDHYAMTSRAGCVLKVFRHHCILVGSQCHPPGIPLTLCCAAGGSQPRAVALCVPLRPLQSGHDVWTARNLESTAYERILRPRSSSAYHTLCTGEGVLQPSSFRKCRVRIFVRR